MKFHVGYRTIIVFCEVEINRSLVRSKVSITLDRSDLLTYFMYSKKQRTVQGMEFPRHIDMNIMNEPITRYWTFTLNDPQVCDEPKMCTIKYIIFSRYVERMANGIWMPVCDGFICFKSRHSRNWVQKMLPNAELRYQSPPNENSKWDPHVLRLLKSGSRLICLEQHTFWKLLVNVFHV